MAATCGAVKGEVHNSIMFPVIEMTGIQFGERRIIIMPIMLTDSPVLSHSGEDFHPTSNSLIHGTHVPSKEGIDRMVEDVEKQ